MATDIREFMKLKQAKEQQNPGRYMDKIREHRRIAFYRFLAILVVLAIVGIVLAVKYQSHIYTTYEVISSTERVRVPSSVDARLGNAVLSYSKDGAFCMNEKGNVSWNLTYEMDTPIVSICENIAAIAEYNGSIIYIADTQQQLGEIRTELPIKNVCVAANGVTAAVLEDADTTWIYVYDKEGNVLVYFRTKMVQSGYPIAMSLSPSAKLMVISYLYVDVGTMKSSVAFYNFDSVGQSKTDRYMSGYDYVDTVVPMVKFLNNDTAVAVADNRLMIYKGSQKPESSFEKLLDNEVQAVYTNDKYIALMYHNDDGEERNLLEIYNENGNIVTQKAFSMDYTDFFFEGDRYVIYNPNECSVYSLNGTEKFSGIFDTPVNLMNGSDGSYKYILVTENALENIQLR